MSIELDEQGRPEAPTTGDEIATLLGFLDYLRATIGWKTDGLRDDQLHEKPLPSTMSLGGMLKHLAFVEDFWIGMTVRGRPPAEPFSSAPWDDDPDWEWSSSAWDTADELRGLWGGAVEALQPQRVTARIDDRDRHRPVMGKRFGLGGEVGV